ncbi:hypothetical protein A3B26_03385 [Candidatus Giovannonibacteria bacterium RIFCSPLOWO2_01_FULL_48_47]|nr:MAG: hypothetical protein A3D61_02095 [Candidatus Giovannonibacteria bacterium RIFCSPHIGHO2_02_FULL_48_15]OGF88625.1 MAG: hypothetical protein A3B26_03385 [Candidatus Giovannonibacteria bacterium RIFCSPLOWO2_01_FULL_48_47]OGF94859.1 MAG: hypothetical protein A2433_02760 [Candidatus Giovannonibacteria bacterium RIFOXYC1_FULL_48_8]OGF95952.1 MAG: hypothetical protein A2613_00015 [Candidatus Giovannonibacteria bacterium RIFOXYD1_FULL_48_21]
MIDKKKLKYLLGILPLLFFASLSFYLFAYSSPERIVDLIGVNNAYALLFILAFLGGLTTFSGVPYHLFLITLATGGLNPLFLGFSAAGGVMLGDSTSYYVGYRGGAIAPEGVQRIFQQIYSFNSTHPKILPLFCLLYGSFVPFSNDFITISAGIARYPFWRVMIPLGLGNAIFNVSLAYLSTRAYDFLSSLL